MFTEMLIATAILLMVLGAALSLVDPARQALRLQPQAVEMQQRLRAATTRLQADLLMAGGGPHPPAGAPLSWLRAAVVPALVGHRHAPDSGATHSFDAITVFFAPPTTTSGRLASRLVGSPTVVRLALEGMGCRGRRRRTTCDFSARGLALVFDETGRSDIFRITTVDDDTLGMQAVGGGTPLSFSVGDTIIPLEVHSYYLDHGAAQLRVQDGWVADFPLVDNVVGFSVRYFGRGAIPPELRGSWRDGTVVPCLAEALRLAPVGDDRVEPERELAPAALSDGPWCGGRLRFDVDLFRVSRVRIEIRLQAAADDLRGTLPLFFVHPGSGRPGQVLPDLVGVLEVSPRSAPGV